MGATCISVCSSFNEQGRQIGIKIEEKYKREHDKQGNRQKLSRKDKEQRIEEKWQLVGILSQHMGTDLLSLEREEKAEIRV